MHTGHSPTISDKHLEHIVRAQSAFAHPKRNTEVLSVQPGMVVADFGAGSGAYVYHIAEELKGAGTVYAIDVQKDLLLRIKNESHRRGLKVVHTMWGDVEKQEGSKLATGSVDIVLMSNILFQLDDKRAAFVEAHRILKHSGTLAVIDWNASYGGIGPRAVDVVHKDAAMVLAEESGFAFVDAFPAGMHHYGLLMKKKA